MAEVSHQASGAAGSNPSSDRVEQVDGPARPRPKVLIPPVASPLPADPPAAEGQQRFGHKGKRSEKAPSNPVNAEAPNSTMPNSVAPSSVAPSHQDAGLVTPTPESPGSPLPPESAAAQGVAATAVSSAADKSASSDAVKTLRAPAAQPGIATVQLTHVDPWSVMKQAFLLSLAIAIIILVASAALWFALDSAGVFAALTRTATDVGGEGGATVGDFLSFSKVMGVSLVLAGIETVLVTALVTLFAFLYNLAVGIGGGLEVTLSEEG